MNKYKRQDSLILKDNLASLFYNARFYIFIAEIFNKFTFKIILQKKTEIIL